MKFAIFDAANLFNRAHHVCAGDAFTKAAMALHIVFNSMKKVWNDYDVDHFVIAGEGRSWRYDYYPQYKAKRILNRKLQSPKEKEENEVYFEILKELMEYFKERTRMTVLQAQGAEGDDFIARWIQLHPDDEHIIISGDSDNIQLLSDKVSIYDGLNDRHIKHDGVYNNKKEALVFHVDTSSGKIKIKETVEEHVKNNKKILKENIKKAKEAEMLAEKQYVEACNTHGNTSPQAKLMHKNMMATKIDTVKVNQNVPEEWKIEPDWHRKALFIKIIRGDTGDGIFSSNPGVRYKGSKSSVGIEDAWEDRHEKGFNWNNFMLKKWEKAVGDKKIEVTVKDEFAINESLIDLTMQPDEIKDMMDQTIVEAVQKPAISNLGIHFVRFCAKYELTRLGKDADQYIKFLGAPYIK